MNIFDIHSHLLPGVDDGANNLEVSLQMAKQAVANHVSKIIVTPHFSFKYQCLSDLMALKQVYCDFKEQLDINEIPLTIYFGLEILYSDELLDYLKDKKIKGINDTN
ncbi:MAG: CpsB/CapC family capsule biosynthesis tyrosine phosphatase, partial [Thomasclavelia spiroformis]